MYLLLLSLSSFCFLFIHSSSAMELSLKKIKTDASCEIPHNPLTLKSLITKKLAENILQIDEQSQEAIHTCYKDLDAQALITNELIATLKKKICPITLPITISYVPISRATPHNNLMYIDDGNHLIRTHQIFKVPVTVHKINPDHTITDPLYYIGENNKSFSPRTRFAFSSDYKPFKESIVTIDANQKNIWIFPLHFSPHRRATKNNILPRAAIKKAIDSPIIGDVTDLRCQRGKIIAKTFTFDGCTTRFYIIDYEGHCQIPIIPTQPIDNFSGKIDNKLIVTTRNQELCIFDYNNNKAPIQYDLKPFIPDTYQEDLALLAFYNHQPIRCLEVTPNQKTICLGLYNKLMLIIDLATNTIKPICSTDNRTFELIKALDNNRIITLRRDARPNVPDKECENTCQVWDLNLGSPLAQCALVKNYLYNNIDIHPLNNEVLLTLDNNQETRAACIDLTGINTLEKYTFQQAISVLQTINKARHQHSH